VDPEDGAVLREGPDVNLAHYVVMVHEIATILGEYRGADGPETFQVGLMRGGPAGGAGR